MTSQHSRDDKNCSRCAELERQLSNTKKDLECAQENFRVTNRAYCKLDVETRELRGERFAPSSDAGIKMPENPDAFLEGWNREDLPPTFHAYAWRLYHTLDEALNRLRDEGVAVRGLSAQLEQALLAPSSTAATTVYQAPSGFKLLPKEPTDAMLCAIDAYFAKWQGIVGGSDTARKADCWSALQVYHRMYEAAEISEALAPSATTFAVPKSNDGKEQEAFEAWAKKNGYDVQTHPLHWLFLDKRTYAARDGWRSALEYVEAVMNGESWSSSPSDIKGERHG